MDTKTDEMTQEVEQTLPIGTMLSGDQFTITGNLGAGGFGKTYRAEDNVLGRAVVIKECFHDDFCIRDGKRVVARTAAYIEPVRSIVRMFMREARSLAKLRHPNIVGVHCAFEENETAYMVIDLIEGRDLLDILSNSETPLSPGRVRDILVQLLDAIEKVHEIDLLHRDISPDNILIEDTGTPVLIDFGAARAEASRHTRAVSSLLVVKDGYSPHEFYVPGSDQTPSSDLYALAATFYHVLSGEALTNSQVRMVEIAGQRPDPCTPLAGRIEGYDDDFLRALDQAMRIHPNDRLQTAAKWRNLIAGNVSEIKAAEVSKPRRMSQDVSLDLERSLSRLVTETNDEVRRISQITPEAGEAPTKAKTSQKPSWIDEFNKESLSPKSKSKRESTKTSATEPKSMHSSPIAPSSDMTQTNWISRALEKQEQRRREEAAALGLYDDAELTEIEATSDLPVKLSETTDCVAPRQETAANTTPPPLRLIAGLLICFCFMFFFEVR